MWNLAKFYPIWMAVVFGIGTGPLIASEPAIGLKRLAAATVHPPNRFDAIVDFAPENVARLHLTAPASSEVLINGVRTRSTGRDRYFQIPVTQTDRGTLLPTRVEVLQLTYGRDGETELESHLDYRLHLLGGKTTRLTAMPARRVEPAAKERSFVNMTMPTDDDRKSLPAPAVSDRPSAADCPDLYTATLEVRYRDADDEEKRTPRLMNWAFNPSPEILISHGVEFNADVGCKVTDVSLSYKLFSISGDPKTSRATQLGDEHQIRGQDVRIQPSIAIADVQNHLQIAISENLKLKHNAERVIAKDWKLKFKLNETTTCESTCDNLKYEVRIVNNHHYN